MRRCAAHGMATIPEARDAHHTYVWCLVVDPDAADKSKTVGFDHQSRGYFRLKF